MAIEYKLPELAEGVETADVSQLYVSEGDTLEKEQDLLELETEKAVMSLPSPHAGKVSKVHVSAGDTVKVGQVILTIEEAGDEQEGGEEEASDESGRGGEAAPPEEEEERQPAAKSRQAPQAQRPSEPKEEEPATEQQPQPTGKAEKTAAEAVEPDEDEQRGRKDGKKPAQRRERAGTAKEPSVATKPAAERKSGKAEIPSAAGPTTRRLARELHVDLGTLRPAEGERIRPEDVVEAYVGEHRRELGRREDQEADTDEFGPIERERQTRIEITSAERLSAAWRSIPHVTQLMMADITELEAARRKHAEKTDAGTVPITLTAIVVKSAVFVLKQFPRFNATYDEQAGEIVLKRYYHIGVAVDTRNGLLVPVVRDADRKSIRQIAAELVEVAQKARDKKLARADMVGGTFTVSNQGGLGGGAFTPIINQPQVAILGVARTRPELRMIEGTPAERLMLPLALSYDHRVNNGADAARFVERLAETLSDAFTMLLEC